MGDNTSDKYSWFFDTKHPFFARSIACSTKTEKGKEP